MRQFMKSFDTARGEPAFSKRLDAIVGGILDRQNMPGPIDRNQEKFAQDSFRSMQRKALLVTVYSLTMDTERLRY